MRAASLRNSIISLIITTITILAGCGFDDSTVVGESELMKFAIFQGRKVVADQVIVKYKDGMTGQVNGISNSIIGLSSHLQMVGVNEMKRMRHSSLAIMKINDRSKSIGQVIRELESSDQIEYAEPDYIVKAITAPDDTYYSRLWGLNNSDNGADVDAPEAWEIESGNGEVIVAVIDTGVDYNHVDLAENMWKNPGEIPGNGIDDDKNGYVDDVYGIDVGNSDSDPMDDNKHGTHCSGIIGAVGNNHLGVIGICPNVRIMACKFLSAEGFGATSDSIECIDYAIANGATILSNSWGGDSYTKSLEEAIERAKDAGVLFLAAAGNSTGNNDEEPFYPASYINENIIAVASIAQDDRLSWFSCYGATTVDVAAPGSDIYSTVPGSQYDYLSGTSMATPLVAGIAALLKSNDPSLDWSSIKQRIIETSVKTPALEGKVVSSGRVNAYNALSYGNTIPTPSVSITSPSNGTIVEGNVQISTSASDSNGIDRVEFYINGSKKYTDSSAPYVYSWNTSVSTSGSCIIRVAAYNISGGVSTDTITVSIKPEPVEDTTAPTVNITSPYSGSEIKGNVVISADASDDTAVTKVEFRIDGKLFFTDETAPYSIERDSASISNGVHEIAVTAYDAAGNMNTDTISVSVNNSTDDITSEVKITSPSTKSVVRSYVSIIADASSTGGIKKVVFYVNGVKVGEDSTPAYGCLWDTRTIANGKYIVKAVAIDSAGNRIIDKVKVKVKN